MFPNSTDANEKPTHQITQIIGTIRLRTGSCTPINKATATGGTLNAGTIRFQQGDLIRLRWTTDEAMVLHLHGYDIEGDIAAGEPTSMVFDADLAGRFPTERHGTKPVTLVYVEVYPK
jgi:FtsP/CotA-like multicopper oxidase with cupredoxin domain